MLSLSSLALPVTPLPLAIPSQHPTPLLDTTYYIL